MVELHQRERQFGFQASDAEWRVIELHLFLVVAMWRMVAAENLDRPIRQPFQYGLAVARRAQRRVHLEVRVEHRPARLSAVPGIELHLFLVVAMWRMVAAENLDRPIRQPFQYGLAVARRAQRRVHLEVRVVRRPARLSAVAGIEAKNVLAIRVPESIAACYRRIRECKMMRASLSGNW